MIDYFQKSREFISSISRISGVSETSVASVFHFLLEPIDPEGPIIDPKPYELTGFSLAFEGLFHVTPWIKRMTKPGRGFRRGRLELETIVAHGKTLGCETILKLYRENFSNEQPELGQGTRRKLHGRIVGMSLFSALAFRKELEKNEDNFDCLMAHMLLATEDCIYFGLFQDPVVRERAAEAFRVCRGLAQKHQGLLYHLPREELNRKKYISQIQKLLAESVATVGIEDDPRYFEPVELFLRKVFEPLSEEKALKNRYQAAEGMMTSVEPVSVQEDCGIDNIELIEDVLTSQVQTGPKTDSYPELDQECASRREVLSIVKTMGPRSRRNLRRAYMEVKQGANALALLNQMFPFAKSELTPHEILVLLDVLDRHETNDSGSKVAAKLALSLMFWSGASFENVCETWMVNSDSEFVGVPLRLLRGQDGRIFRLIRVPELLKSSSKRDQAYHIKSHLKLQIPKQLAKLLELHVTIAKLSAPCRLFNDSRPLYQAILKLLRPINKEGLLQITPVRVANCLVRQLINHPNCDIAGAMLLTGREHFLARSKLHYTAHDGHRLAEIYNHTCRLMQRHGTVLVVDENIPAPSLNRPGPKSIMVGTPLRAIREDVQKLVVSMRYDVRSQLGSMNPASAWRLRRFHEIYTAYTCMFVNFATGFRAVKDPSFLEGQIDKATGFGILRDKDDREGYNTRLVWMWDECIRQLDYYREHSQKLFSIVAPFSPTLVEIYWPGGEDQRFSRVFTLNQNNRAEAMSPKALETTLESCFNYLLPANTNRHYLRSGLLEAGCSREVIDAFLGHWHRGEEPWSRFSGLSPLLFRDELKYYLVPLLSGDGWFALEGLGGLDAR